MAKSRNSIRLESINNIDFEVGIPMSQRRVIARILMQDYYATKGKSWPSQRWLSTKLGVSLRTVQRAVWWGEDLGIFERKKGPGARNTYLINYKRLDILNKLWKDIGES